jgi:hypothetical protein
MKPRRFHALRPRRERGCRTAPAQRREILEEEREIVLCAENVRREAFDLAGEVQKLSGGLGLPRPAAGEMICL